MELVEQTAIREANDANLSRVEAHLQKITVSEVPPLPVEADIETRVRRSLERGLDEDEARARIRASMEAMRELHFNADEGMGDATPFPRIPANSPEARTCRSCRFRELCDR